MTTTSRAVCPNRISMIDMTAVFIASTDIIIAGLFKFQHDKHCQDYRWHAFMMNSNPNYLQDIAERQAAKRANGIGPEGMCHA